MAYTYGAAPGRIQVVFVPDFVMNVAKFNNVTLDKLFIYENFKRLLSPSDQASLFALQDVMMQLFNPLHETKGHLIGGINNPEDYWLETYSPTGLYYLYGQIVSADNNTGPAMHEDMMPILTMAETNECKIETMGRLFSTPVDATPTTNEVYQLNDVAYAVVIKSGQLFLDDTLPSDSVVNVLENHYVIYDKHYAFFIRALESILKQLYVYLPQETVNGSIWNRMYVNLLAKMEGMPA